MLVNRSFYYKIYCLSSFEKIIGTRTKIGTAKNVQNSVNILNSSINIPLRIKNDVQMYCFHTAKAKLEWLNEINKLKALEKDVTLGPKDLLQYIAQNCITRRLIVNHLCRRDKIKLLREILSENENEVLRTISLNELIIARKALCNILPKTKSSSMILDICPRIHNYVGIVPLFEQKMNNISSKLLKNGKFFQSIT